MKFPVVMEYQVGAYKGLQVEFTSDNIGEVIKSDDKNQYEVGYSCGGWNPCTNDFYWKPVNIIPVNFFDDELFEVK